MCCDSVASQITKWLLACVLKEQPKHMKKIRSQITNIWFFLNGIELTLNATLLCVYVFVHLEDQGPVYFI